MRKEAQPARRNPWPLTIGAGLWSSLALLAMLGQARFGLLEVLFLFAPLVVLPLCFPVIERLEQTSGLRARTHGLARSAQPWAAAAAAAAFFFAPGKTAAGLALPWQFVCILEGLAGLLDLPDAVQRGRRGLERLAVMVARVYLPIGGGWLVLSRLGETPLHFGEPIVLLTAVHFHYAGFAAAVIMAAAWRFFGKSSRPARWLFLMSAAVILAGPALLATGFVISPVLQLAAALLLSAAQALFGLLLLRLLPRLQSRLVRALVGIAGATLVFAMALAAVYAWGEFSGEYFILIPRMAELHGTANAFGFTLASLVAWNVVLRQKEA